MISENFETTRELMRYLSIIVNLKTTTLSATLATTPREKVIYLLNEVKPYLEKAGIERLPYTRQDMANYLGIRVETVIRTIKELEAEGKIKLEKGKICFN
jgi:CRP-like cAMP-binding protein